MAHQILFVGTMRVVTGETGSHSNRAMFKSPMLSLAMTGFEILVTTNACCLSFVGWLKLMPIRLHRFVAVLAHELTKPGKVKTLVGGLFFVTAVVYAALVGLQVTRCTGSCLQLAPQQQA